MVTYPRPFFRGAYTASNNARTKKRSGHARLYRALAAHQGVEEEIVKEVESTSLILYLATSYLMKAFVFPEVTVTTQGARQIKCHH